VNGDGARMSDGWWVRSDGGAVSENHGCRGSFPFSFALLPSSFRDFYSMGVNGIYDCPI